MPTPMVDSRDMYAKGYQDQQSLYTDDYARTTYGAGEGAYAPEISLVDSYAAEEAAAAPAEPAAPAPGTGPAPPCASCGKATEWIDEYGRYYCYDCDAYV